MQISEAGISLIETFEGLRLSAYQDSVGVWTIGYGHTRGVRPGMVITLAQANQFLRDDIAPFQSYINAVVKVPISQKMDDALLSFVFNVGQGSLAKSSLLRLLNLGDYQSAADGFLLWNRAGGIVMAGLTRRREMERALFLQGVADLASATAPAADATPAPAPQSDPDPVSDPSGAAFADPDGTDDGTTPTPASDSASDPNVVPDPVPDDPAPDPSPAPAPDPAPSFASQGTDGTAGDDSDAAPAS